VLAFEPRRLLFQTLCANVALNSIVNVHCRAEMLGETGALGEAAGTIRVPPLDPSAEKNHCGLELGGASGEIVPVIPLDSLQLSRCNFLKIDLPGSDLNVLRGAAQTIAKHRPLLYVASNQTGQRSALINFLLAIGYRLYCHKTPLFKPDNFYLNSTNEFGSLSLSNILGVHSSVLAEISGLKQITDPAAAPP
jgi:FkbM family methyltransferase